MSDLEIDRQVRDYAHDWARQRIQVPDLGNVLRRGQSTRRRQTKVYFAMAGAAAAVVVASGVLFVLGFSNGDQQESGNAVGATPPSPELRLAETFAHEQAAAQIQGQINSSTGWPTGLKSALAATTTLANGSNFAATSGCSSSEVVVVRLIGSLNVATGGLPTVAVPANQQPTVDEITFVIDTSSGTACGTSVGSSASAPDLPSPTVLYQS
jgi:hypothetical protein